MLSKLFKYDFKKIFKQVFVFFILSIACAGIARICTELGKNIAFFKIVGIFVSSVEYALLANVIIQPLVRIFAEFGKTMYGDESYLTHTLPVTKTKLLLSKCLSALAVLGIAFVCLIVSVIVLAYSKTNMAILENFFASAFGSNINTFGVVTLLIFVLIAEFISLIMNVFTSIILANKENDHKVLKGFIFAIIINILILIVLVLLVMVIFASSGNLSALFSSNLSMSNGMLISLCVVCMVTYLATAVLLFFFSKHELNKGVNVAWLFIKKAGVYAFAFFDIDILLVLMYNCIIPNMESWKWLKKKKD